MKCHEIREKLATWLFGIQYEFTHESGVKHIVRAKNEMVMKRKMRAFIRSLMCGDRALGYNPSLVETELGKCTARKVA